MEHNTQSSDIYNEETSWLLQPMSQQLVISFLDLCVRLFVFEDNKLSFHLQARFKNKDFFLKCANKKFIQGL